MLGGMLGNADADAHAATTSIATMSPSLDVGQGICVGGCWLCRLCVGCYFLRGDQMAAVVAVVAGRRHIRRAGADDVAGRSSREPGEPSRTSRTGAPAPHSGCRSRPERRVEDLPLSPRAGAVYSALRGQTNVRLPSSNSSNPIVHMIHTIHPTPTPSPLSFPTPSPTGLAYSSHAPYCILCRPRSCAFPQTLDATAHWLSPLMTDIPRCMPDHQLQPQHEHTRPPAFSADGPANFPASLGT